jgi:murein DD-endopeptidase MepM/ murein hydrolase activator NlpD
LHSRYVISALAVLLALWPAASRSAPPVAPVAHAAAADAAGPLAPGQPGHVAMPDKWLPSRGRQCGRHGKKRFHCQGPRRAPLPHGPEAELAAQLELGTTKTVTTLMFAAPKPEWVFAAGLEDSEDLLWPVDTGMLWRGLQRAQRAKPSAKLKFRPAHKGLDIGAPVGSPIRAVQSGLVAYADNGVGGYGNLLVTIHPDNSAAFYAHCRSVYVFPGQYVVRGQIVAEVGTTGITRGPHLHFEYRKNGRLRDPLKFFERRPES